MHRLHTRCSGTGTHPISCRIERISGRGKRLIVTAAKNAGAQQVGFARVVTDFATFAWLCDLFVVESHRGHGLGKWLVECIVDHPELRDLHIFLLATRDAHELYRHYGRFEALPPPDKWMVRRPD